MTVKLSGQEAAARIAVKYPDAVIGCDTLAVTLKSDYLLKVAEYLKDSPELSFNHLIDIAAVDYYDNFEIVYRLTSLQYNQSLVLKVPCHERVNPVLPSLTGLWRGADFMEREIFDLMGISFTGHPNLKRIFLWEGFTGHPLRKDFV
jgi:NADH-quinone oxidoreductase subunit C